MNPHIIPSYAPPEMIFVTLDKAKSWLDKQDPAQRKLRPSTVERYCRDMISNKWGVNHQNGIAFDKNGLLIDGQHRLTALKEACEKHNLSGVPMWVWKDQELSYDAPIDQGIKRSTADLFGLNKAEGTIIQHLHVLQHNKGTRQSGHNTPAELERTVELYLPLVRNLITEGLPADLKRMDNPMSPCRVTLAAFAYAHPLNPTIVEALARDTARMNADNHVAIQLGTFFLSWKANGRGWSPEVVTNVACDALCSALADLKQPNLPKLNHGKRDGYTMLTELRRRAGIVDTHTVLEVPSPEKKLDKRWKLL